MSSADTLFEGSIPRSKVAQVCAEALVQPTAKNKVVEIANERKLRHHSLSQRYLQMLARKNQP